LEREIIKTLSALVLGLVFSLGFGRLGATPRRRQNAVDEINYLLGFIERSGCKFYRNGSWYNSHRAAVASAAIKYNLSGPRETAIKTVEDFIEQAATRKQQQSGQEYQIQCEAGPVVQSGLWLHTALIATVSSSGGRRPRIHLSPHKPRRRVK